MKLVGGSEGVGVGITGTSNTGIGVCGTSNNIGVRGDGDGFGVVGGSTIGTGVAGTGGSVGVSEEGSDAGVRGESGKGYGGSFQGGLAPLMLEPSITDGHPNTEADNMGELYVDNVLPYNLKRTFSNTDNVQGFTEIISG
jgi:hypothetical protein